MVCCGIILSYAIDMDFSHWLIIELIWAIVRQNKVRWESQTENRGRRAESRDVSQLPEKPSGKICISRNGLL